LKTAAEAPAALPASAIIASIRSCGPSFTMLHLPAFYILWNLPVSYLSLAFRCFSWGG
jgi:hypothetical protein